MAGRSLFSFVSLILVAGGLLFMFLILLGGAPPVSRWSYWNVCNVENGRTVCGKENYSKVHPAFPLDPSSHRNFGTDENVPGNFVKHHGYYFLMTRFMFAFMLIALFFGVCALFTGLLALCTRIGSYLSGLLTMIAMFFQTIQAALMTAAYVKGRDNFRSNGQSAQIGKYAFGFEWAAVACFFLSTVLFCLGGGARRDSAPKSTGRRRFGGRRTRSTRSRGSFVHDKEYGA